MTRTRHHPWRLVLLVVCAATAAAGAADVDVPYLTGRIVDNANIMEALTRGRLSDRLKAHEQATGNQVVVLTVPTTQSVSIEDYTVKVFESWKLGQKDKDNGVLVVVAPQDRKMRIEVGYGLESTLTDGACGQIIRNVMTPHFKTGAYDRGIEAGVGAIVARLEGTGTIPDAPPEDASAPAGTASADLPDMPWYMRLLLGAFIFGILGLFTVVGLLTPGVGWFLYFFLIPFWAMFPFVVIGGRGTVALLGCYVIGYPVTKILFGRTAWYKQAAKDLKTKGTAKIGGFTLTSSSGSSGSSWDSGSSSSSFSGGGGSSGGGGCSGSW